MWHLFIFINSPHFVSIVWVRFVFFIFSIYIYLFIWFIYLIAFRFVLWFLSIALYCAQFLFIPLILLQYPYLLLILLESFRWSFGNFCCIEFYSYVIYLFTQFLLKAFIFLLHFIRFISVPFRFYFHCIWFNSLVNCPGMRITRLFNSLHYKLLPLLPVLLFSFYVGAREKGYVFFLSSNFQFSIFYFNFMISVSMCDVWKSLGKFFDNTETIQLQENFQLIRLGFLRWFLW